MIKQPSIRPEQLPAALLQGHYLRIYRQMGIRLQKRLSFRAFKLSAIRFNRGVKQYKLQSILPLGEYDRYVWADPSRKKWLVAMFHKKRIISSILFTPITVYRKTDQQFTNTTFIFPFRGKWFTFWGGNNVLLNYHYAYNYKRYAYDFAIVKEGKTFHGNPRKNTSYFAFGQEILAPAAGKVVRVENSIPDNEPVGKMNKAKRAGNFVVIDHGSGEYSFLAHLQMNSVRVQVGDVVQQGDVIGLCGNSGNSTQAHLHFQVSTSPEYPNTSSIRIRFRDAADPIQGQFVTGS